MSAGLRSPHSLISPHSNNELACDICYNLFDISSKIPLIVCARSHQMCGECVKAIRKSKRCPFCRENIDLQSIKINRRIVRKLVGDPNEPNIRHQILQQSNFYISPLPSEEDQDYEDQIQRRVRQQQRAYHTAINIERERKALYLVTLFLLLPFFFLDFYFGFIDQSQPECKINKKLFGFMNVQTWFRVISLNEALYVCMFLIVFLNHKCRPQESYASHPSKLQKLYVIGLAIKALICCIVEVMLQFAIIFSSCDGNICGYGMALTMMHLLKIIVVVFEIKTDSR